MIREATDADIPQLLEWGQRFADRARLCEHVGYDPASMARTFALMIDDPAHVIFINERGAIGGLSGPHPFNHSHYHAEELFWWSEGGGGLELLRALERWAKAKCGSLQMKTLEAIEPERTGQLYSRLGFTAMEHGFVKVF